MKKQSIIRVLAIFIVFAMLIPTLVACKDAIPGPQGEQGLQGIPGVDGVTPTIEISEDGYWVINGVKTEHKAVGQDGKDGEKGDPGDNGASGETPTIAISEDGYWVINGVKTNTKAVGKDGENGALGETPTIVISDDGYWVINGVKTNTKAVGKDGENGVPGETPTIEISDDGYWVINGVKSNVKAEGKDGQDHAYDNPQGLAFYLKEDDTYAVGIGSAKYLSKIVIPATYRGKAVTEIADFGFYLFENDEYGFGEGLAEVVIPEGITRIGIFAFAYFGITDLVIPESVTEIGQGAFWGCPNLESVTIPESVVHIGKYAFDEITINCSIDRRPDGWSEDFEDDCEINWHYGTPHNWIDTTCETAKYCTICLATDGEPYGHFYGDDKKCVICGKLPEKVRYDVPAEGYDGSAVTIRFYHQMGARLQSIINTAIADFNKLYPNIRIQHQSFGDYNGVRDQIKTEIAVGNQPHLAYCYPDHVALYNMASMVVPLDNFIESTASDGYGGVLGFTEGQKNDFVDAFYSEGTEFDLAGTMYSLPVSKSTEVLYYNKTFFEEHNLEVPTTWEEMEEVCKKIKEIDPDSIPLGYDSESNWFITMCEQYGSAYTSASGENFLFNNQTNIDFVTMFRTWYKNRWVTTEELAGGYTSSLFTGDGSNSWEGSEASRGTRCYMCIASTGGATYQQPKRTNGVYEFEVGITSIPQVNPAEPKVIFQGPSICMFKKANPQEIVAAWLFAKFLTTDQTFQAAYSMTNGYAPVIKSVVDNPTYAQFLAKADEDGTTNIIAYAVKVAIEQQDAYFALPAFNGSSVARDQVGLLLQKVFTLPDNGLEAAIKKAFEDAVDECKYQSGQ